MKYSGITTMIMILALLSTPINAEIVLVVNSASSIAELDNAEVARIYTGRYTVMPNGDRVEPYDHPVSSDLRARFYVRLLNKTIAEMNSYWARLLFSGRARPPRQLTATSDIGEILRNNNNAIIYVDSKFLSGLGDVRVVFAIAEE